MREILFRGKNRDGVWLYGDLRQNANAIETDGINLGGDTFIEPHEHGDVLYSPDYYAVNPDTVGQFTGMMDRSGNGVKIFEGDIVKTREIGQLVIGKTYTGSDLIRCGVVGYASGKFEVIYSSKSPSKYSHEDSLTLDDAVLNYEVIVIGNIHDNPSLLTA